MGTEIREGREDKERIGERGEGDGRVGKYWEGEEEE
jgi:hypothetical protein